MRLTLVRAGSEAETPHQLVAEAAFAHLERWVGRAEPVTCEYGF